MCHILKLNYEAVESQSIQVIRGHTFIGVQLEDCIDYETSTFRNSVPQKHYIFEIPFGYYSNVKVRKIVVNLNEI